MCLSLLIVISAANGSVIQSDKTYFSERNDYRQIYHFVSVNHVFLGSVYSLNMNYTIRVIVFYSGLSYCKADC